MKKTLALLLGLVLLFASLGTPAMAKGSWTNITDVVCVPGCTVARRSDGRVLYTGDPSYPAANEVESWSGIEWIESQDGGKYLVGYRPSGEVFLSVVTYTSNLWATYFTQTDVDGWTNVRKLVIKDNICLGLRYDGGFYWVVGTDEAYNAAGAIKNWPALADVGTDGYATIYGLDYNGRVYASDSSTLSGGGYWGGRPTTAADWTGISALYCTGFGLYGVRSDRVLGMGGSGWNNVAELFLSTDSAFGLRYDGTVAANFYEGVFEHDPRIKQIDGWRNIVQLGFDGFPRYVPVGLRADGSIVAVTTYDGVEPYGYWDFSGWSNVKTIFSGMDYTIGLRADGSLLVTGGEFGTSDYLNKIASWKNVRWIYAAETELCDHIVALCQDGTLLAAGENSRGQCNVT